MNPNELDQDAVNLAKAIKTAETRGQKDPYNAIGDNNTSRGAYQFQDKTWKEWSKKYLGIDNAPMTVENQNKVAYSRIKERKDAGLTPAQIASEWNSGDKDKYLSPEGKGYNKKLKVKYDVPGYVAKVSSAYEELKKGMAKPAPVASELPLPKSNAMFASNPNDSALTAGLKALGNTPQSAFNFVKGIVTSPIQTVKNIGEIGSGFGELAESKGTMGAIGEVFKGIPKALYETLVPKGVQSLVKGDTASAAKEFTEDPFGQAAPLVLTALGGAKALDKTSLGKKAQQMAIKQYVNKPYSTKNIPEQTVISDTLDKVISKTGQGVIKPTLAAINAPLNLASKVTKSATSQLVGLEPQSISQILSNPKAFSKLKQEQATRGNLASEFGNVIDDVEISLQETGKAYNPIRQSKQIVPVPPKFIDTVLGEFGITIKNGKVTTGTKSATRNTSDVNAIQKFYDDWGKKKRFTGDEYLNMRSDLAEIARYDKLTGMGRTAKSQVIADAIRQRGNEVIRPKFKGLKELDEQFAPQIQQFNQIKKDFLQKNADGEYVFKDGAVNKIATAANKGKDQLLARMEEIMPGVTKKIQILNTVEDIQKAYGNKVGTYARGVTGGVALTGNIPAIIAAIITNPGIAVPLLRATGYTAKTIGPILSTLKMIAGDVNKMKLPSPLAINSIQASNSVPK